MNPYPTLNHDALIWISIFVFKSITDQLMAGVGELD